MNHNSDQSYVRRDANVARADDVAANYLAPVFLAMVVFMIATKIFGF